MGPELSRRLGNAAGRKPITPQERRQIIAAAEPVDTWDELPANIRALVEKIEARPDVVAEDPSAAGDKPDPTPAAKRSEDTDLDDEADMLWRAGDENGFKKYWLGKGLKKWALSNHPWTSLYRHLARHMPSEKAKRIASQWFFEHFGMWPGERKGKNPVGPG